MSNSKVKCKTCNWQGVDDEIDIVEDPKHDSDTVWQICPECRDAEQFNICCDEPNCWKVATCGSPTLSNVYRHTCDKHIPKDKITTVFEIEINS